MKSTTARDHAARLERATAHANVLLDRAIGGPATAEHEAKLKAEAFALWEHASLPSAMFETTAREATHANAAWRRLFESRSVPEALFDAVVAVRASSQILHVPELSLGLLPTPSFCALTLRPRFGVPDTIIVVCAQTTDEVIGRHLGVPDSALVWSAPIAGGSIWTSSAWSTYTGSLTDDWTTALHPDDRTRCLQAFQEAARLRVSSDVEARLRREDGSYRWHRVCFTMDLFDRWFGTAIESRDQYTTDDERAELLAQAHAARADAEQASRLKDQFLAAVSHELRAPMTTMLLWEKVLRDETAEVGVRTQALSAIHESAVAQSRLIGDLLDVSRAISGKLFVDLRPVDVVEICREAIEATTPLAAAQGVTIAIRAPARGSHVHGDAARLRQVLDNLLSNAIKFSDPGGEITVEVVRKARRILLSVTDTGRGIAPEFLPHIFEVFSQTDDTLTRDRGGLGLGLAIVKELVELHHGSVIATSDGRGRGTTVTVSLPASSTARASTPVTGVAALVLGGVHILLVDDDPRVRDALALLLGRAGAIVHTATSAESARGELAAREPTVIVCDIAMPGEDGFSFIRRLRASGSAVPAIALTAHAMAADAERAFAAGFDKHLAKPIDFEHLVDSLRDVLATRTQSA